MKKFEFAKYYDITEIGKKRNPEYSTYEKIYLCVDVTDFWLCRIQKGINKEYEREEGVWLIERDRIEKEFKGQGINIIEDIYEIVDNDEFENWDIFEHYSLEECIEEIDGGYGIGDIN